MTNDGGHYQTCKDQERTLGIKALKQGGCISNSCTFSRGAGIRAQNGVGRSEDSDCRHGLQFSERPTPFWAPLAGRPELSMSG